MIKISQGPFSALSVPGFRRWFVSQVLSSSGLFTQTVAAAWLILQQTGRPIDLSFLTCASFLPVLFAGSWGGALVDRFDRRRLLILTQSAFLVLSAILFGLAVAGRADLTSILLISALTGFVNAADNPARQVYVLELVGRDKLVSAVSLFEVVLNASRVIGPGLGGVVLAVSGPAACFAINAASFLAPLVVLLRQHPSQESGSRQSGRVGHQRGNRRGGVLAGLRYVRSVPEIRACVVLAVASGLIFNGVVLYPLLARNVFHLGGGGYGALVAAFGIGAVPGALLAARSTGRPRGRMLVWLACSTTCSILLTAFAPDIVVGLIGMALSGTASIWYIASANTLVQLRAAPEMRGRVMGVWTMAMPGMTPITSVLAAVVADLAGVRITYAATGVALMIAALSGRRALLAADARPDGETESGGPVVPSLDRSVRVAVA